MTEAKFRAGDKVVLIRQYPDGSSPELFNTGELILGREYYVEGTFLIPFKWCPSGWAVDLVGCGYCVDQDMLVLAEEDDRDASAENISLDNTKIDVQEYANRYNITLERAHNEIQPWLFEQGYVWPGNQIKTVRNLFSKHLCIYPANSYYPKHFTWMGEQDLSKNKQIFLDRHTTLTLRKEDDIVEILGKKYNKAAVMAAIKNFEIVE